MRKDTKDMLRKIVGYVVCIGLLVAFVGCTGNSPTANKGVDTTTVPISVRSLLHTGDTLMTMNKEMGIGDTQYISAYKAVFAARNADPHFVDTLKANGSNKDLSKDISECTKYVSYYEDLSKDISEWTKYVSYGGGVWDDPALLHLYELDSVARATVDASPMLTAGRMQYGLWTRETSPVIIITSDSTAVLNTYTGGYKENPAVYHLYYDACQGEEIEGPPSQSKLKYSIDSTTYNIHFMVDTLAWKIPLVSFANLVDSTNTPYTYPLMNTFCNIMTSHTWKVKKVGSINQMSAPASTVVYDVSLVFFNQN